MEAPASTDILTNISSDLLAAEILPWLSYGQLTKVARVSKKFADIVKRIGPFTIDTFYEGWLDRQRVQLHVERCKYLTLNSNDLKILVHLARVKELQLQLLDVQNMKGNIDTLVQCLATIIKNNRPNCLRVLAVPVISFKKLVEEKVVCSSLRSLVIRNVYSEIKEVPETKDILAVFPSLKRIELLEGPQTDLYKYLTEHVETPLEYVHLRSYDMQPFEGNITADLKGLDVYLNFPPDKKEALKNLKNLTHLKVDFGWTEEQFTLPKLKDLVWLDIHSDQTGICKSLEYAKNLTYLSANQKILEKLTLPQSLKSISTRIIAEGFKPERLVKLPYLEELAIEHDGSAFWGASKCGLAKTLKRIHIEGHKIDSWSPKMNVFANLTHFTLRDAQIEKIPREFFTSCPKLVQFAIHTCHKLASISTKLECLKDLEVFIVKGCALTSIPEGLKDLQHLQLIDLRNNKFDKDCVIPLTLPVRTVTFKDREWIQILQLYLKDNTKVPTVKKMFTLPYLPSYKRLEEGRLGRVLLHGLNVKGVQLETNDDSSDYLAGALMCRDFCDDIEAGPDRLARDPPPYHAKDVTVGIILFNEYNTRNELGLRIVRVVPRGSRVKTFALEVANQDTGSGWSSRSVWKLQGYIHEFKDLKVTEKEKKYIRSVVEPR